MFFFRFEVLHKNKLRSANKVYMQKEFDMFKQKCLYSGICHTNMKKNTVRVAVSSKEEDYLHFLSKCNPLFFTYI